jgi:hypothetical protein
MVYGRKRRTSFHGVNLKQLITMGHHLAGSIYCILVYWVSFIGKGIHIWGRVSFISIYITGWWFGTMEFYDCP